ncbi:HET-domain-containing protein [Hypoxylon trugodes]|uniref:HET-domain-containing protein n=1 Tax=Hypoxylon trugodes TaxID=326681 RepID=UPI002199A4BA|nr:HET-domain-containing protein [Hypoxylon trugodes]KAI1383063.1 HET-domain-containing protein [Hypoxylon trugodes]
MGLAEAIVFAMRKRIRGAKNRTLAEPVPTINLPHRWNQEGELIANSKPDKCHCCGWSGDPDIISSYIPWDVRRDVQLDGKNIISLREECAVCQLLNIIFHRVAPMRNITGTRVSIVKGYSVSLECKDRPYEANQVLLFTTEDLTGTPFEHYNILKTTIKSSDWLFETSSQWAQRCISKCLGSHGSCNQFNRGNNFLPSRLIDVDSKELGGDVVLIETKDIILPDSRYVALSYCWGNSEPECMTTNRSFKKNIQRIKWRRLPKTFQDAVIFTRSLGLKYLWIDSMCIIQKNKEDWRHEAGQMFGVYRNAYVTLAALYGDSSASGLRSSSMNNQLTKMADLCYGQYRCPIYIRQDPHYLTDNYRGSLSDYHQPNKWAPLLCRAWTYQERMVSPRVLYFDKSEIIFQCFSTIACECGITQYHTSLMSHPESSKSSFFNAVIYDGDDRKDDRIDSVWRRVIVEEYSSLALSEHDDRLAAVAAIAEQFQTARPSERYLAGLWSGSLIKDLLWRHSDMPNRRTQQNKRLCSWPTWSWTSLQSQVAYSIIPDSTVVAQIVWAGCGYAADNLFGVLVSSILIIRARVLPCLVEWQESGCSLLYECGGKWMYLDKQDRNFFELSMDCGDIGDRCFPVQQNFCLLEVIIGTSWDARYYLILYREEMESDIFSRVGLLIYHISGTQCENWDYVWREQSVIMDCEIR